jgi:hypothetical protein
VKGVAVKVAGVDLRSRLQIQRHDIAGLIIVSQLADSEALHGLPDLRQVMLVHLAPASGVCQYWLPRSEKSSNLGATYTGQIILHAANKQHIDRPEQHTIRASAGPTDILALAIPTMQKVADRRQNGLQGVGEDLT